jgi:hypothetical protein
MKKFLDGEGEEKLRIKFHTEKGKVLDVVIQYETLLNNIWTPLVRYDCSHGFFHRDVLYHDSTKEKQAITITTLEEALNYGEQDIKDRWEFYKERYLKRLKS